MKTCKCNLRTRLVGDGCEICNPELAEQCDRERLEDEAREAAYREAAHELFPNPKEEVK